MKSKLAVLALFSFALLPGRADSFSLGTTNLVVGAGEAGVTVTLWAFPESAAWSASTTTPWLHLPDFSQAASGSTNVLFFVDQNTNATARVGTVTVAGRQLTVTQAGANYVAAGVCTLASGYLGISGIALDEQGNVFATFPGGIIKWVQANNVAVSVPASGLSHPVGVAVDAAGNLFVADQGSGSVEEIAAGTGFAATVVPGDGSAAIASDSADNLYMANGSIIKESNSAGGNLTVLSTMGSTGLTVDPPGKYVYFGSGGAIERLNLADNSLLQLASTPFGWENQVAVDGQGNVFVAAHNPNAVQYAILKWTASSNVVTTPVLSGAAEYFGAAVDKAGNLFFSDTYEFNGYLQELPNAWLDGTTRVEPYTAGSDSLLPVLPATANLLAPLGPVSDSSWLIISSITNGVVTFGFTQNTGLPRTGHISIMGRQVAITQLGPAFALPTAALFEGPAAGTDSVTIAVSPSTGTWTVTTNASWLHLDKANQSGSGSTNIVFTFDANTGGSRSGSLFVGGQKLTVTQAAGSYVPANPLITLAGGFTSPSGVALDGVGNVYVCDSVSNSLSRWNPSNGTVSVVLQSGLNDPSALTIDPAGNVYIADAGSGAVLVWNPMNSNLTTLVSGLSGPVALAGDGSGNIYIANAGDATVREWLAGNQSFTNLITSGLSRPSGLTVDFAGNVYIADGGDGTLKCWNPNTRVLKVLVDNGLTTPGGLAADASGNVYVADSGSGRILEWSALGRGLLPVGTTNLSAPATLAVDLLGSIYVADQGAGEIREVPRAFVDVRPRMFSADAGTGALPQVLPPQLNLAGPFTPTNDAPWLFITGASNGVVSMTYPANFASARSSQLGLLGQSITVTQEGLTYLLGSPQMTVGPGPGTNSLVLGVSPAAATWTANSSSPWLHLEPGSESGTGSALLLFTIDANTGPTRTGWVAIGDQTFAVTQAGVTYVPAGTATSLNVPGLTSPTGVALDAGGNVYMTDPGHNAIKEWIEASNNITTLVTSAGLNFPHSIAVDSGGNLYFSDQNNSAVKFWSRANGGLVPLVSAGISGPQGVALDHNRNVFFVDLGHNAIKEFLQGNNSVITLVGSGLASPWGVAVDAAGNVYFSDSAHNAVKEWLVTSSNVVTLASITNDVRTPRGVAVDGAGNVYFVDGGNNAVKEWIAADNAVVTLLSTGLQLPMGIAVDGDGNIFVCDSGHNLIKEIPRVFIDSSTRTEPASGGFASLPGVLPSDANLAPPFAPTSDQPWLSIQGFSSGVVTYSFAQNTGPARIAHIQLAGQSIPIIQSSLGTPTLLGSAQWVSGRFQFSFTNDPGASFTVLSTTNASLPFPQWSVVGAAANIGGNLFQFTSEVTTPDSQRFYIIRSP